jgi:hypothetical protein
MSETAGAHRPHMARLDFILAAVALTALLAVFGWTAFH